MTGIIIVGAIGLICAILLVVASPFPLGPHRYPCGGHPRLPARRQLRRLRLCRLR